MGKSNFYANLIVLHFCEVENSAKIEKTSKSSIRKIGSNEYQMIVALNVIVNTIQLFRLSCESSQQS